MTDIATITGTPELRFNVAPGPRVEDIETAWTLALVEEQHRRDQATIDDLTARLHAAQTEQIIDGADPRLVRFWERAGRIADEADFCREYDRLADELNGVPRERDWTVSLDIALTVSLTRTVTARTDDDAISAAEDEFDRFVLADAISGYDIEEWEVTSSSAERD